MDSLHQFKKLERKEIEEQIIKIIKKHIFYKETEITCESKLSDLPLESIALLGISVDLENYFRITLTEDFHDSLETIAHLTDTINIKVNEQGK